MQQPTSTALNIVIPSYRWHTQMFDNMLKDINAEDAAKRIEGRTNNITWTLGNLVNCRYWLANVLGIEDKDPNDALFKEGKAYDAAATYPTLEEFKKHWHSISKKIYEKLLTVTDEELNEAYEFGMSVEFVEENKLNMVGMAVDRCSYLLGQLGLLRRAVANVGTSYDIDKSIGY
ncbi:MAG: DinB family protein [Sphingobacteriales bacterium]|nr:MAG: DinB family protein [Sphingobacteriales bacterium]